MSPILKFVIGLLAVIVLAWIHHGPLGNGARFVDRLDQQAQAIVVQSELPVQVRLARDPLARVATLSGNANDFQRYGLGGQKGITQLIGEIPGMSSVRWADRPQSGFALPLLLELFGLCLVAYLAGVGLAWPIWGRPKPDRYAP